MHTSSQTISDSFFRLPGSARKTADLKLLSHLLTDLHRRQSLEGIMGQAAHCLFDIIEDRLTAVAVLSDPRPKVWTIPFQAGLSVERVIFNDFPLVDFSRHPIPYVDTLQSGGCAPPGAYASGNPVFSMDITTESTGFRFYIQPCEYPRDATCFLHADIRHLVLESAAIALSRQMKIDGLKRAAAVDPLTGCYNRREFEIQLKRCISTAVRQGHPLSLIMFDLDHFKKVNDRYGHPAGDAVLSRVAETVQAGMRKGDILARYGGEEFMAILPGTARNRAIELAERLRRKISGQVISHEGRRIRVTASFGIAELARSDPGMTPLVVAADAMLYRAKLNGRNRIMPGLMAVKPPRPVRAGTAC